MYKHQVLERNCELTSMPNHLWAIYKIASGHVRERKIKSKNQKNYENIVSISEISEKHFQKKTKRKHKKLVKTSFCTIVSLIFLSHTILMDN